MSSSTTLKAILIGEDRSMGQTFDKVGRKADSAGKKGMGFGKAMKAGAAVAVGASALAATGIVAGLTASINKAMDYDKTMRLVGATLGTTGKQQEALGALALKMGADTVFSAKDAGDAMLELAKGGLTAANIQGGALKATMTLAAAGALDMGSAATYVGNALNTFRLKAKDSESVAAALAGGANASSASVESLGQALSQVGPGARSAGLSLQTTTGILAAFDNAGIKGSDAGTSLKTMLTRLVPATKEARDAMKDLGLKFTDARGKFLPMSDVAQQLQDKMSGLTDEQRTLAMNTIFGSDATRAATVMMNLGAAGVKKYTAATSDQAAAQRMANTQTEGAAGAWEAFKGSVETLAISLGVKLLPMFTKATTRLTEIVNTISSRAMPVVARFTAWFTKDLWPALQRGYQTIMPGLKSALSILSGGVNGSSMSWKKFGDYITQKVIPFIAQLTNVYLPMWARQIRAIIEVVKVAWRVFTTWRDIMARVWSTMASGVSKLMGMWATMLRALSHVPGFGWAKTAADKMDNAAGKARAIATALDRIPNTVPVDVRIRTSGGRIRLPNGQVYNAGMRAGGGPVGGRFGPLLVGENGPEILSSGHSGHITPARQTAQILAGRGATPRSSGRGGYDGPEVVQVVIDGKVVGQALLRQQRITGPIGLK